ncbi:hypothetical protein GOBAR_AA26120 [Gossypium barbadense]|uniref:Uncharacterized protein n=1 Tax=Gossypium barbadense TaxID=3634 RepID=A0A2P5WTZ8_GOSBA|nr:hypothetical protein GOBAR_AA26120 [Gossypium barbadense]
MQNGQKVMEDVVPKVSYRNKLMGLQNSVDPFQALEDFEVQEGDVKAEVIGSTKESYMLWTLVKHQLQQKGRETNANRGENQGKSIGGSRFNVLNKNHGGDDMAESVMEKERITEKDKGK